MRNRSGALAGVAILAFPGWLGPQGNYYQALLGITHYDAAEEEQILREGVNRPLLINNIRLLNNVTH